MNIKHIIIIVAVFVINTNLSAQDNTTINLAENLCNCLDEAIQMKRSLKISVDKSKAIGEKIDRVAVKKKQIEIMYKFNSCSVAITKHISWDIYEHKLDIYNYVKANCPNYSKFRIFKEISKGLGLPESKNRITPNSTAKDYRKKCLERLENRDYFNIMKYCNKAIELDKTDKEKNILINRFLEVGKNILEKAKKLESQSEFRHANVLRWNADLPLLLSFEFDYPNRKDIAKIIYENRLILGDTIGANIYKEYLQN